MNAIKGAGESDDSPALNAILEGDVKDDPGAFSNMTPEGIKLKGSNWSEWD